MNVNVNLKVILMTA